MISISENWLISGNGNKIRIFTNTFENEAWNCVNEIECPDKVLSLCKITNQKIVAGLLNGEIQVFKKDFDI